MVQHAPHHGTAPWYSTPHKAGSSLMSDTRATQEQHTRNTGATHEQLLATQEQHTSNIHTQSIVNLLRSPQHQANSLAFSPPLLGFCHIMPSKATLLPIFQPPLLASSACFRVTDMHSSLSGLFPAHCTGGYTPNFVHPGYTPRFVVFTEVETSPRKTGHDRSSPRFLLLSFTTHPSRLVLPYLPSLCVTDARRHPSCDLTITRDRSDHQSINLIAVWTVKGQYLTWCWFVPTPFWWVASSARPAQGPPRKMRSLLGFSHAHPTGLQGQPCQLACHISHALLHGLVTSARWDRNVSAGFLAASVLVAGKPYLITSLSALSPFSTPLLTCVQCIQAFTGVL
jgi:hypothetical protein